MNQTGSDARPNGRVVFVRSAQGSIYRSVDDGKNWVSQRDLMITDEEEPYQARVQQMIFRYEMVFLNSVHDFRFVMSSTMSYSINFLLLLKFLGTKARI